MPSSVCADLPRGWDVIVARLLAKDPAERPQSTEDLRQALDDAELGTAFGPQPLLLPRADSARARAPAKESGSIAVQAPSTPLEDEARYRFETPFGQTEISVLSRAVDAALDRSVVIERYHPEGIDPATEARIRGLAKSTGAFLQRTLAFDPSTHVAVLEAPVGVALSEAPPMDPPSVVRLLQRLTHALTAIHQLGIVHGALSAQTIVIDDDGHPTILASGLGPARSDVTREDDLRALLDAAAPLLEGGTVGAELLARLSAPAAHIAPTSIPTSADALLELLGAAELALLRDAT